MCVCIYMVNIYAYKLTYIENIYMYSLSQEDFEQIH